MSQKNGRDSSVAWLVVTFENENADALPRTSEAMSLKKIKYIRNSLKIPKIGDSIKFVFGGKERDGLVLSVADKKTQIDTKYEALIRLIEMQDHEKLHKQVITVLPQTNENHIINFGLFYPPVTVNQQKQPESDGITSTLEQKIKGQERHGTIVSNLEEQHKCLETVESKRSTAFDHNYAKSVNSQSDSPEGNLAIDKDREDETSEQIVDDCEISNQRQSKRKHSTSSEEEDVIDLTIEIESLDNKENDE